MWQLSSDIPLNVTDGEGSFKVELMNISFVFFCTDLHSTLRGCKDDWAIRHLGDTGRMTG